MSRILRRPMFRGGPVDSRGSGITSGLDKPKRGLVNEPGGYAGEKSGMDFLRNALLGERFTNPNYVSPMKFKSGTGFGFMTPERQSPGLIKIGEGISERNPRFDTLGIDELSKPVTYGASQEADMKKSDLEMGEGDVDLSEEDKKGLNEFYESIGVKEKVEDYKGGEPDKIEKTDKIIDLSNTEGTGGNEEESTELTVKDYIKMLGGDKARRRDTSDLLAQASAAFLGTGSVREGLSEFMNKVAASGPGRLEKIEQAAASLDIKDKIASKRADEQLKTLLGKADYEAMLKLRMSDPSLQSFETNLVDTAKSLGKSYKNIGVIGNTINKKYGSGSFGGEVSDDTNYVEGKYYIQDTGTGEKIVFKIVEGKAEEVHRII
jgi:hypothetical protein